MKQISEGRFSHDPFGCMKGLIKIIGDIESPILPAEDWDMLQDDPIKHCDPDDHSSCC